MSRSASHPPSRRFRLRVSRRVAYGVGAGLLFGAGVVLGWGPLVRSQVDGVAERYGGEITYERAAPTWLGVRFEGVSVALHDAPDVTIAIDTVGVDYRSGDREILVQGAHIQAVGELSVVREQLQNWRQQYLRPSGEASDGGNAGLRFEGVHASWRDRAEEPTEQGSVTGFGWERYDGGMLLMAESASAHTSGLSFDATAVRVKLDTQGDLPRLALVEAKDLAVDGDLGRLAALGVMAATSGEPEPAPSAAPSLEQDAPGSAGGGPPAVPERAGGPEVAATPEPQKPKSERAAALARLQRGARATAQTIAARLAPGATVSLPSVRATIRRGADALHVGPGALSVRREEEGAHGPRLWIALRPGGATAAPTDDAGKPVAPDPEHRPLTFSVSLPLSDEPAHQALFAEIHGGPIHLATMGVGEGDFGLFRVAETEIEADATLLIAAGGSRVELEGTARVDKLNFEHRWLSRQPLEGLAFAWRGKLAVDLDKESVAIEDGEIGVGQLAVRLRGEASRHRPAGADKNAYTASIDFDVPLVACQSLLDSSPRGMLPKLEGMKMTGSYAISGHARFDTANIDKDYDVDWQSTSSCRVVQAPAAIDVQRFRDAFSYTSYSPDGKPSPRTTGPGTADWTSFRAISRFMEVSVITQEDGGFRRHDGFSKQAIINSIRENLKSGSFRRGASTISMQLAKNIYLEREKTLSRKLQEAFLTMYLEQELTKDQMLELYLNVIEFGPNVYGIKQAARHYFNSLPSRLSLGQAMYLGSILPNPKKQHFGAGGAVSPGWMSYLHKLMRYAEKNNRISPEDLEIGLGETVVRGSPAPIRAVDDASDVYGEPPPGDDFMAQGEPWATEGPDWEPPM